MIIRGLTHGFPLFYNENRYRLSTTMMEFAFNSEKTIKTSTSAIAGGSLFFLATIAFGEVRYASGSEH